MREQTALQTSFLSMASSSSSSFLFSVSSPKELCCWTRRAFSCEFISLEREALGLPRTCTHAGNGKSGHAGVIKVDGPPPLP